MAMLLMIDNYDSFTFNLVQYFRRVGEEVHTVRNDALAMDARRSPGASADRHLSGTWHSGRCRHLTGADRRFSGKVPILGVCLGHQAIGQYFGGRVVRAKRVMHGKADQVEHDGTGLFAELPAATR
jgi:anthranilate synthase component 2